MEMEFAVYTISVKGFFSRHYEIYRDDELIYRVEKPSFFAFRELNFLNTAGQQVLKLKRSATFFNYKFVISDDEKAIATFEKDTFENFYRSTSVYGYHTIQGDFFNSEYTVFDDKGEIAKVSRKRFRTNKKYGIAIIKGNNEIYILAMVIAISVVNAQRRKKG
ncbi:MAG: LURP-one-related family protein [Bacteroidota bacterium]